MMSAMSDPWDPWYIRNTKGYYELTSVELTVTNLCNLRCEYCAVGEELLVKEQLALPVELIIQRLDEVPTLQTLSITGGEPILSRQVVEQMIKPILAYAKSRGVYTQLNSNLTLPLSRYEGWIDALDVLHISYNYRDAKDFYRVQKRDITFQGAEVLFERIKENARTLTSRGVFVSAESLLSPFTALHIVDLHKQIAQMGCGRHEIHPLYPSDFAKGMELLSLKSYRDTIYHLLDNRDKNMWILFGTLPFFPCSDKEVDLELWLRLHSEENITVRQDPDGRNRLNINVFTGDVRVTDFSDVPPVGNIKTDCLATLFNRWLQSSIAKKYHCFCQKGRCAGPNILVANSYYSDTDFLKRSAKIEVVV